MVTFIVMLFLWGLGGKAGYDISMQKASEDTGRALSADILTFGGIVFGSFTGVGLKFVSRPLAPHTRHFFLVGASCGRLQLQASCRHTKQQSLHPDILRAIYSRMLR